MKKVFKYATGQEIPAGAIYLSTVTERRITTGTEYGERSSEKVTRDKPYLVWHYFLVEAKEE